MKLTDDTINMKPLQWLEDNTHIDFIKPHPYGKPRICPDRALRQGESAYILNAEPTACQGRFNGSHFQKQP